MSVLTITIVPIDAYVEIEFTAWELTWNTTNELITDNFSCGCYFNRRIFFHKLICLFVFWGFLLLVFQINLRLNIKHDILSDTFVLYVTSFFMLYYFFSM